MPRLSSAIAIARRSGVSASAYLPVDSYKLARLGVAELMYDIVIETKNDKKQ
jgi:hypothetical protein